MVTISLNAKSQEKTIHLPEFNFNDVKQDKYRIKKINLNDSISKETPVNSVAELLSRSNAVYVKNYGPGGVASSSSRGGSAQQSNIIWNGFSINSPSLAMCDLSLLPVNFFDEINLVRGAASILYGSGTAGAVIELVNRPNFNNQQEISVRTLYNSLKNSSQFFSHSIQTSKFSSKTDIQLNPSKNDFEYTFENEKKKQRNSEQKIAGIKQDFFLKHKENLFQMSAWIQNGNRQIPQLILQNNQSAYQKEITSRFYSSWKRKLNGIDFSISAFSQYEKLNYYVEKNSEPSRNTSNSSNIELFASKKIKNQHISFLSDHNLSLIKINYENRFKNRNHIYNCLNYKIGNEKFSFVAGLRQDYFSTKQAAVTYNLTLSYVSISGIEFYLQNNNLFRAPSLNDLYWIPGGNSNLYPETGMNSETGITINKKFHFFNLRADGLVYHRDMKNLIIWLPTSTGIWAPKNIHTSKHYGSETKMNFQFIINKNTFAGIKLNTNYNVAYRTNKLNEFDNGVNQQQMYCPMYSGSAGLYLSTHRFTIVLNHVYTGYRYISEDRSNYLAPFQLSSFQFNYRLEKKQIETKLFFSIENIFNATYQTISQFAMPGRYFSIGTEIKFKKTKNEN